ncbi:tRNA (adenosine(37)-N6)-threonylcarbamoyltransferase complex dimerization subunit type 1 TsaB [Flavicella sp.]|uniref:tRNA (adenosine(37)-N6)-threonylcarbamoyltransferase complex dimerization subunit type 1 TsaB n=1 Tax=Flavicella sp. TaxID=2957742 RepID=UPI0030180C0D
MAYILNFDTATKNCSVSVSNDGELLAFEELNSEGYSHGEKLHVFIEKVLKEVEINISDLAAVCVGKGPGSYTGLRIGVSAAKGICFALDIPLISIETLDVLASAVDVKDGVIVSMLDARRLEVFSAVYTVSGDRIRKTEAQIINSESFEGYLKKGKVYFVGDGAEKCKELIQHKNAVFIDDEFPSAKNMTVMAYEKYVKKEFEDVAYFEPFYLKDFVGIKPKPRKQY